jgi:hypothetical protein
MLLSGCVAGIMIRIYNKILIDWEIIITIGTNIYYINKPLFR